MDIETESLKIYCPHCTKKIILTFNTNKCPKCQNEFNIDEVHKLFYEYQSQVLNSTGHKVGKNLESFGNTVSEAGGCIQNIGCIIFLFPLALFLLYLFFATF